MKFALLRKLFNCLDSAKSSVGVSESLTATPDGRGQEVAQQSRPNAPPEVPVPDCFIRYQEWR